MEGLNCLTSEAILSPEPLQQNISLQKTPSGLCSGTGVGVFFVDGTFWVSPGPQFPHLLSLGVPSSKAMLVTPTKHWHCSAISSPLMCGHPGTAAILGQPPRSGHTSILQGASPPTSHLSQTKQIVKVTFILSLEHGDHRCGTLLGRQRFLNKE